MKSILEKKNTFSGRVVVVRVNVYHGAYAEDRGKPVRAGFPFHQMGPQD